jgi:uncharacterized membrane protein YfcA
MTDHPSASTPSTRMSPSLQKRIALFYLGGVINAFLGLYVLIEGASFMPRDKAMWIVAFFLGFAALDFWFPQQMKKKWLADQEKLRAGQAPAPGADGQK